MSRKDYLSDSLTDDITIVSGDFQQGDATDFHSKIIAYSDKGEIRQYPLLGAALNKYIGSSIDENLIHNILLNELSDDGFYLDYSEISISGKSITLNMNVI